MVFTPKALTEIWESVRDQMKAEIVEKEAGDIVNHFKWKCRLHFLSLRDALLPLYSLSMLM